MVDGASRSTTTTTSAIAPAANAPMRAPRNAPARRRPSPSGSSPSHRAARRELPIRAAPARTNCQLPPGSTALEPMSGWRRLPQRTSRIAKSQILIAGRAKGDGSRLAGDQKRGLDVVAGKVNLPVHDAPVEGLRRGSLLELGLVGKRDVAPGVRAGLISRVEARLSGRDHDAKLPMHGLQDLCELRFGCRVLEELVGTTVDVGVPLRVEHRVEARDPRLGVAFRRKTRACRSRGNGEENGEGEEDTANGCVHRGGPPLADPQPRNKGP